MRQPLLLAGAAVLVPAAVVAALYFYARAPDSSTRDQPAKLDYRPRKTVDIGGFSTVFSKHTPWMKPGHQLMAGTERELAAIGDNLQAQIPLLLTKAALFNFEGEPNRAYEILEQLRARIERRDELAEIWLYSIIYCQGVTGLRRGEDENCILCRGECSCILPIVPAAVHAYPVGSRLAIKHFGEYLERFPDDLEVRWLLNLAHMTLGEYPGNVDRRFLISLDRYLKNEFDIGRFRDIGHLVGVNRLNQAGGAIMEDFDNDGLLDIVITSMDPTQAMAFFRNKGDGTFEDRTEAAGLSKQFGGLNCVQVDYNNDGFMDIFIPRGAWVKYAMRPSLLRNNGDGTFTDVTRAAGLLDPVNSISATWADFDNDGFADLFICCERQANRLYRNKGDGTFEEMAVRAGVQGNDITAKGAAWLDYDNDGYPDLYVNNFVGPAQLFHNNRNGTFTEVTQSMGITGVQLGFSCWAWDFDNDGWLDLFATSYDRTLADAVKGLLQQPHGSDSCRLYRNLQGKGFQDVTKEAGLDMVFATMGSNFADFDNDGYLDMYLGTGDPDLSTLVPNRMFKNVGGKRFAEISTSTGTAHLQKGHGVACGDWDRDGNVDIFIELGGATNGDKYHNALFQNPGQGNHSLTLKLIGKKTNRAALGARIKVVTAAEPALTVHRHVTSGSSFGANPLEQTIGLGKADRIALLEIHWPTSGTTQVFRDIAADQAIEVVEFADRYRKLNWKRIAVPK